MKKVLPAILSVSAAIVAFACAMPAIANIDTTIDYSAPGQGEWILWRIATGCTVEKRVRENQSFVIEVSFGAGCNYTYFELPSPQFLDGTIINLTANIGIEELKATPSGSNITLDNVAVKLGYDGYYTTKIPKPEFQLENHAYDPRDSITQEVGGDFIVPLGNVSADRRSPFAQMSALDLPAFTGGPKIFIQRALNPDETVKYQGPFKVRLRIDDVHFVSEDETTWPASSLQGDRVSAYLNCIDNGTQNGKCNGGDALRTIDDAVATTAAAINSLRNSANTSTLSNKIVSEWDGLKQQYDAIVSAYQVRAEELKVPTQAQYNTLLEIRRKTEALSGLATIAQNQTGPRLIYYPWNATGATRIEELSLAIPTEIAGPVSASLSLNEIEPLSVVLQNIFNENVTVQSASISNLKNQFNDSFPAQNIDIRIVKSWYTKSTKAIEVRSTDQKIRTPELLLKDDGLVLVNDSTKSNALQTSAGPKDISSTSALIPNQATVNDSTDLQAFTLPAYTARQLWLNIDTRQNVLAGEYQGNLVLAYKTDSDSNTRQLNIPINVNVAPVVLGKSALEYSIYYRGKLSGNNNRLDSENKNINQYNAELRNMRDHGIEYPTQYVAWGDSNYLANITNHFSKRLDAGLPCDKLYLMESFAKLVPDPPEIPTTQHIQSLITAARAAQASQGTSNCNSAAVYLFGKEEQNGAGIEMQTPYLQTAKNAGAKVVYNGSAGAFISFDKADDQLINGSNFPVDTMILAGSPDIIEISKWNAAGKNVLSYANPQIGIPDPSIYRANYGFLLWQRGYAGAMDYAYQHSFNNLCAGTSEGYCSIWNDFDSTDYYDHVFAYPTTNGVIDTVQWEGFREAVDDTRYLATLQSLAQASNDVPLTNDISDWLAVTKQQPFIDPQITRTQIQDYLRQLNRPPVFSNVVASVSGTTILVTGEARDPENYLASIEVKIDDSSSWINVGRGPAWQASFPNNTLGSTHTIRYRATDYWGTTTASEITKSVQTAQTITVTKAAPATANYNSTFTVSAKASSGLQVKVTTSDGCTNNGNTITVTSGTNFCYVHYDQPGNAIYAPAPQKSSQTTTKKIAQIIKFDVQAGKTFGDAPFSINPQATTTSSSPINYSTNTQGVCVVPGLTVATITAGTCNLLANAAADANYLAATQKIQAVKIAKANQPINVTTPAPASANKGSPFPVAATVSSGQTVAIAATPTSVCTYSSGKVTIKSTATSGSTCKTTFSRPVETNYNAATATNNTTVN